MYIVNFNIMLESNETEYVCRFYLDQYLRQLAEESRTWWTIFPALARRQQNPRFCNTQTNVNTV